jgi:hypothetical protein
MTKHDFLTLWQQNTNGQHNEAIKQEVARVFKDAKPNTPTYDFIDGKLVKRKPEK